VFLMAATCGYAVKALSVGEIVPSDSSFFVNSDYSVRVFAFLSRERELDVLPYLGISTLMEASVWLVGKVSLCSDFSLLVTQMVTVSRSMPCAVGLVVCLRFRKPVTS